MGIFWNYTMKIEDTAKIKTHVCFCNLFKNSGEVASSGISPIAFPNPEMILTEVHVLTKLPTFQLL